MRPALSPCRPTLAALVTLAVAACIPAPPTAPPPLDGPGFLAARAQAVDDLQRACGVVRLRPHPQFGTMAALEFAQPPTLDVGRGDSPATGLRDFLLRYRALFGVASSDMLDYDATVTDALGQRHIAYVQRLGGVAVWGSGLVGHLAFDRGGYRILRLHGHLFPLTTLAAGAAQPALSAESARQQALAAARRRQAAASLSAKSGQLYYLPTERDLALVYRVEVAGQAASFPVRWAYFIDAQDGTVRVIEDLVARLDVKVPATGHGRGALGSQYTLAISQAGDTYYLEDPTRGSGRTTSVSPSEKLPGRTLSGPASDHFDEHPSAGDAVAGLAVDLHAHLATLWDYFAAHHGRFGWDGSGNGPVAVAHLGERANVALSDGERLLFGDGDGRSFAPLGAALDVVAHEYVHAIDRASADLAATGESGALSEGLADLLACLIEGTLRPVAAGTWTLGEEIYHPAGAPGALADLAEPHRSGQAAALSEYLEGVDDPLAPPAAVSLARRNAGIPAHAGYLLAGHIGVETTAAIVYRALTTYLLRYSGFADGADAMAAAARDLGGDDAVAAVRAAWQTVGVD